MYVLTSGKNDVKCCMGSGKIWSIRGLKRLVSRKNPLTTKRKGNEQNETPRLYQDK